MKLVGISMVKNEEDVIEAFVRHNLTHLDALVVLDNGSSDGTRPILRRLMAEGLPLAVIDDPDPAYRQKEKTTALLRRVAATLDPEWIFPLDADEFLVSEGGSLRSVLEAFPKSTVGLIPWKTYVPTADDPADPCLLGRVTYRRSEEPPGYYKVAVPATLFRHRRILLAQGNHSANFARPKKRCPEARLTGVSLAHFPVRSAQQIQRKALVGWLSYLAKPNRCPKEGFHWKDLYSASCRDVAPSTAEVSAMALTYMGGTCRELLHDPVPQSISLRYVSAAGSSVLQTVARMAETLALELARRGESRLQRAGRALQGVAQGVGLGSRGREREAATYLLDLGSPGPVVVLGDPLILRRSGLSEWGREGAGFRLRPWGCEDLDSSDIPEARVVVVLGPGSPAGCAACSGAEPCGRVRISGYARAAFPSEALGLLARAPSLARACVLVRTEGGRPACIPRP